MFMNYKKCELILEMCCNHQGILQNALDMIDSACDCGVNIVKFQKRNIESWAKHKPNIYYSPHPNQANSFGRTYKEHRQKLEFSLDDHKILIDYIHSKNMLYSCSVFDIPSCKDILSISPDFIKIPSCSNSNISLLNYVCDNFNKLIHLSTGMTSEKDIEKIVNLFDKKNRAKDLVLYVCTSSYPVIPKDLHLLEITKIKKLYGEKINAIGFSGHHLGTLFDNIAYTLGATYIERHFTLNRNQKGTDHKAALEPLEVKNLLEDLDNTYHALTFKEQDILEVEKENLEKLKW